MPTYEIGIPTDQPPHGSGVHSSQSVCLHYAYNMLNRARLPVAVPVTNGKRDSHYPVSPVDASVNPTSEAKASLFYHRVTAVVVRIAANDGWQKLFKAERFRLKLVLTTPNRFHHESDPPGTALSMVICRQVMDRMKLHRNTSGIWIVWQPKSLLHCPMIHAVRLRISTFRKLFSALQSDKMARCVLVIAQAAVQTVVARLRLSGVEADFWLNGPAGFHPSLVTVHRA